MTNYATYNCDLGCFCLEYLDDVIISLKNSPNRTYKNDLKTPFTDSVFEEIIEYLNGNRKKFSFKYNPLGTKFQKLVWAALCDIPYGETRTYKEIAIAIGNEKACRAVGMANNKNPLMIIIPCHRVVGSNGSLVGYAGGLDMKKFLLNLESKNC